jgi:hypothetical protein
MPTSSTVRSTGGRRVVRRRRPALDAAIDTALSDLPVELRRPLIAYADAKRAEYESRSALSTLMTPEWV